MPSKIFPIHMARSVAYDSLMPARKLVVSGEGAGALAAHVIARSVCERRQVRFVCGDNQFDPYAVSRFAKRAGVRPEDALRRVLIARAFTAHQFAELVSRLNPDASNDLTVISGPCSAFFDEDMSSVDAARLFYRMLWRVVELARSGMNLLLVQGQVPQGARRAYFLKDLYRASDVVLNFGGQTFTLERRGRMALPRAAAMGRTPGD